ncbi:MAG TPA: hypothetical protein VL201_01705 [Patescibacteria group bacterium]|jgi:hypothetical protein|nr:hypothetical protein [Patescibacteria group bacterium]
MKVTTDAAGIVLTDLDQRLQDTDQLSFGLECKNFFLFEFVHITDTAGQAIITIPQELLATYIDIALHDQQKILRPSGIDHRNISRNFIQEHYAHSILEHLKEFLLKFCVIDFLYEQLQSHKIHFGGTPKLRSCSLAYDTEAKYIFDVYLIEQITIAEWKLFPFKSPKRKNYKDLDRQVEHFIEEELANAQKSTFDTVQLHDWILFSLAPLDHEDNTLKYPIQTLYWFKVADEEIESPLKELFLGKKLHETIITHNRGLQQFLSNSLVSNYAFAIKILTIVSHNHVCFHQFKSFFKIKTQKDLHKKLIELFSYRNDISQRRAIVEEALKVLLNKHSFTIPMHLIAIQKNEILSNIKQIPDYNVYKRQADFDLRLQELAHKNTVEMVLIDQLAIYEGIVITMQDMKGYLNLTKRARLRDFLYFDQPKTEVDGQQIPISVQQLKTYVLREKTINYVTYHLTKK